MSEIASSAARGGVAGKFSARDCMMFVSYALEGATWRSAEVCPWTTTYAQRTGHADEAIERGVICGDQVTVSRSQAGKQVKARAVLKETGHLIGIRLPECDIRCRHCVLPVDAELIEQIILDCCIVTVLIKYSLPTACSIPKVLRINLRKATRH